MKESFLHLYIGDGKGKTTAAIGLAVRAAGHGKDVVFVQFLKGNNTGETESLAKLGVTVIRADKDFGFVWDMDEAARAAFGEEQERILAAACGIFDGGGTPRAASPTMIVLDEVLDAVAMNLLDEGALRDFINSKCEGVEMVLTGREAPEWLRSEANYITEMRKVKHPYDRGVSARAGVEF